MTLRDWPEGERPRERLLERGAQALSDAELIALFLGSGRPGKTVIDLARELLTGLGGLRGLLEADVAAVCAQPGVGPARFALLHAALEVGRRYLAARLSRGDALCNPEDARRFVAHRLRHHPREVFACLFLDNRHRVIAFEELFFGTIDGATVHPREVVRRSLTHNAAALILAHNHPSGVADPSRADEVLTRRLRDALALVDTRVIDHLIVGDGEVVSLAERGLL
jgi:DNA repair protein RadC